MALLPKCAVALKSWQLLLWVTLNITRERKDLSSEIRAWSGHGSWSIQSPLEAQGGRCHHSLLSASLDSPLPAHPWTLTDYGDSLPPAQPFTRGSLDPTQQGQPPTSTGEEMWRKGSLWGTAVIYFLQHHDADISVPVF